MGEASSFLEEQVYEMWFTFKVIEILFCIDNAYNFVELLPDLPEEKKLDLVDFQPFCHWDIGRQLQCLSVCFPVRVPSKQGTTLKGENC